MKKAIVPICIIVVILIFVLVKSCGGNTREPRERKVPPQPNSLAEEIDLPNDEDEDITIIGSPDTIQEVSASDIDGESLELAKVISSKPDQILVRKGYTTSYNNKTKNANWVAWHLTKNHTDGPWKRDGIPYFVDEEVKGARQELEDWYNHGMPIDHGHMCPAGDNKWDKDAMLQSFLLTNMCPQSSALNNGDWKELEERCRGWARHYGEIYIACGPIFYSSNHKTIGGNKVGVPDAFFKVVLCLGKNPKALGFIYPNEGTSHRMDYYVLSVDEVEEKTGIDFFFNLPDDIEESVESFSDLKKW